jgi:hypothetical protein
MKNPPCCVGDYAVAGALLSDTKYATMRAAGKKRRLKRK